MQHQQQPSHRLQQEQQPQQPQQQQQHSRPHVLQQNETPPIDRRVVHNGSAVSTPSAAAADAAEAKAACGFWCLLSRGQLSDAMHRLRHTLAAVDAYDEDDVSGLYANDTRCGSNQRRHRNAPGTANDSGADKNVSGYDFGDSSSSIEGGGFLPMLRLRSKEEQEMVGFGLREILGLAPKPVADDGSETQQVFYATSRIQDGEDEHGPVFGKQLGLGTLYGTSQVQCPGGKPQVQRGFQHASPLDLEEFKRRLREEVARDESRSVLVYVHGCFTDFGRGMGYGAFISRGIDFDGPMVVYSWPTVGRPSVREGFGVINLYRRDEATAMQSALQLKELLHMLSRDVGAKSVHVVAYSMGARTLLEALRLARPDEVDFLGGDSNGVTSHLYFMAPDVAAHIFSERIREFKFPSIARLLGGEGSDPQEEHEQKEGEAGIAAVATSGDGAQQQERSRMMQQVSRDAEGDGHQKAAAAHQTSAACASTSAAAAVASAAAAAAAAAAGTEAAAAGSPQHGQVAHSDYDSSAAEAAAVHRMVERMGDAWGFVGDSVAGLRQIGQAWREARANGWQDLMGGVFSGPAAGASEEDGRGRKGCEGGGRGGGAAVMRAQSGSGEHPGVREDVMSAADLASGDGVREVGLLDLREGEGLSVGRELEVHEGREAVDDRLAQPSSRVSASFNAPGGTTTVSLSLPGRTSTTGTSSSSSSSSSSSKQQASRSTEATELSLREVQGSTIAQPSFAADAPGDPVGPSAGAQQAHRPNTHVHLYAAQNDFALLLSELMDSGIPRIRAGRRTPDFLLLSPQYTSRGESSSSSSSRSALGDDTDPSPAFTTVDVTSLKTGLLTTGHFYLFHRVVRDEMGHVLRGRTDDPWWRQTVEWRDGRAYVRLSSVRPERKSVVEAGLRRLQRSPEYTMKPAISTSPGFWASA